MITFLLLHKSVRCPWCTLGNPGRERLYLRDDKAWEPVCMSAGKRYGLLVTSGFPWNRWRVGTGNRRRLSWDNYESSECVHLSVCFRTVYKTRTVHVLFKGVVLLIFAAYTKTFCSHIHFFAFRKIYAVTYTNLTFCHVYMQPNNLLIIWLRGQSE